MLDANAKHPSTQNSIAKNPCLLDLLIFGVLAFALLLINWPLINVNHIEISDFAANSLLIQKAKHLDLFVGNYSRVGFNHPGPAILYVQAFGELFLYDWLHVVASPFSGQMVASILYNAAWITVVFRMLRTIVGSVRGAGLVTAAFLCIVAYQNFQFFAGMWFPELYFFPFVAALVAASRFASGKADMLMPLALSAGFLINGHVSFLSTLGIIFVLLVLYNVLAHRKLPADQVMFGLEYWRTNAARIARAVGVLLLFFVPLAIETIRHPPGPIADYISFGKQHHANTLGESLQYAAQFWGGNAIFIAAILVIGALFVLGLSSKRQTMPVEILGLLATLLAATAAMIVYSKFGVDMLDQKYIGYFYYAVPALAASLIVVWIMRASSPASFAMLATIAIPVLLIVTARKIDHTPAYADAYTRPDVVDLYNKLEKIKPDGRIVLNLNNQSNWGKVWTTVVGLEVYAKHRGNDLFCIRQSWHILFTKDARCTPDEIANHPQYEVSSATADNRAPADIAAAGLLIRKYPDDFSDVGYLSVAKNPGIFGIILGDGWSSVEPEFVWMQANEAHLLLKVHNGYSGTLQLDLGAFLPRPNSAQHLTIYVNDAPAYHATFNAGTPRQTIRIPIERAVQGRLDIRFVDPDIVSPQSVGMSDDPRTLGVSLYGLGLAH
ncbi:hypothetical protein BX604_0642 [Burkholderia sp. JKS000303]|nr:hypothetical protein BX604_0642 [Burkholderia sp. JKS000303]